MSRRSRVAVVSIVVLGALVSAVFVIGVGAQRGQAVMQKMPAAAVLQAEKAIDKVAVEKNIKLSDGARKALAEEAIHQEAAKPVPDAAAAVSGVKVDQLLAPLAGLPAGATVSAQAATGLVSDDKVRQVTSTLDLDVSKHASTRGAALPDAVRMRMVQDLTTQSEALSKSGLPVDVIKTRNETTLRAIDAAIGQHPITPETYQTAMREIFTKQVLMTIGSAPDGAAVAVEGVNLGKTNITDKPFEPGKTYTFSFRLDGYRPVDRSYYVTPGLDTDALSESLTPVNGDDLSVSTSDKVETTTQTLYATPWVLIAAGVVIVILIVLLVMRRK